MDILLTQGTRCDRKEATLVRKPKYFSEYREIVVVRSQLKLTLVKLDLN